MDVCFVSNVIYPFVTGGAEKRIHEIGRRLVTRGHDVTIYGRHFWDGPTKITREGMQLRAVAPAADLYEDEGRRSITEAVDFAIRLVPTLRRTVSDHDVVVASVFPYFPVLSARLCTSLSDVPLVTTWHEVWGDYWNEYLGWLAPGGKLIEHATAKIPQHAIAVSGVTAERLARIGPARDAIDVVPNGIDIDQIHTAPLPNRSFRTDGNLGFDVLFAGRLIADKNVDTLLDAFDRVADAHDITLGIIGEGPEQAALEAQARTLTHADRVTFLGFLEEYEAVLGHMRAADVFASPSTREGFGITLAEAMAADCRVIAADHPESAASEVLAEAGFLVDPSVEALTATLTRAVEGERPDTDPQERATRYDWSTIASQAEDVYRQAAAWDERR
jgi:glycosyltransferase involved in cell wall biosynthesis